MSVGRYLSIGRSGCLRAQNYPLDRTTLLKHYLTGLSNSLQKEFMVERTNLETSLEPIDTIPKDEKRT